MLFNPAGGLRYHFRALRHRRGLWAPYRQALAAWLGEWHPPEKGLILVGPSAGYCMDDHFLARFDRLVGIEPDPVARALMSKRARIEWITDDFFTPPEGAARGLARFHALLERLPDHAVLFANVLGQLNSLAEESRHDEVLGTWRKGLLPALGDRSWASFHDRVSGPAVPAFTQPLRREARLGDPALGSLYAGTRNELFDHFTEGFFPLNRPHAYFYWRLTPGWCHLIEATHGPK